MKEMSYNERERAEFMSYLEKIKSFGYKVRISNSKYYNYAYIIDEHNVVGYCQIDYFRGLYLSTQHHPNRDCGTGFEVDRGISLDKLTKGLVQRCFCIVPQGFNHKYASSVKKVILDDGSRESKRILEATIEI